MSATSFTHTTLDFSKEKDWPANLGMLDWDNSNIVFTKRSLIEFLKYTGVTVDTNFSNIGKLPRYATIGKFAPALPKPGERPAPAAAPPSSGSTDFIPSRRVRTVPGGPHSDIFGTDAQEGDALSTAPPLPKEAVAETPKAAEPAPQEEEEQGLNFPSSKPSRRVREGPGGNSSLGNFWDEAPAEDFKPTRRVRQGPGGEDNVGGIF
ncbi:hypothetical protein C8J56DRAFT_958856 [Mycena floridula]|nr:hypothetical protein C8J56DRAFT_958856 [Mycena floridula]